MGQETEISWTDATFNMVWGCTRVSEGCRNCYAEALAKRYGHQVWGVQSPRRVMSESYWQQPHKWNKAALADGVRRRVFCSSMADVFENHITNNAERPKLWELIRATPALDWLLLTKRPENIKAMLPDDWGDGYPNVWLGTSLELQKHEQRIISLLQVPAIVHFLSCEPLLGPLDLEYDSEVEVLSFLRSYDFGNGPTNKIDWVIAGGESGPGARPAHPEWFRSLRDQCVEAGVAFHYKQRGEWSGGGEVKAYTPAIVLCVDGRQWPLEDMPCGLTEADHATVLYRIGNKKAGRLLDGRTWDEFPEPATVTAA